MIRLLLGSMLTFGIAFVHVPGSLPAQNPGDTGWEEGCSRSAAADPFPAPTSYNELLPVVLRPGVTIDINAKVWVNRGPCHPVTILAVHGLVNTANIWGPLATALFTDPRTRVLARNFVAIDLPGRGGSGLPTNMLFGDLGFEDYVRSAMGAIEGLQAKGLGPDVLFGHSQGGLVVQKIQQTLKDQGTNLQDAYSVSAVVLLSSLGPDQIPMASGAMFEELLPSVIEYTPELGYYLSVPDPLWVQLCFTDLNGILAANAPTVADVVAKGYNGPEALVAELEVGGWIDPGIFARSSGTRLIVITFEQDTIIRPDENKALYELLTGDLKYKRFIVVDAPESVHSMLVSDPAVMIDSVFSTLREGLHR